MEVHSLPNGMRIVLIPYDAPGLVAKITHDDDVQRLRDIGAFGVPSVQSVQLRMQRRDGTLVWTEHRVVPLRDAAGEVGIDQRRARGKGALHLGLPFRSTNRFSKFRTQYSW